MNLAKDNEVTYETFYTTEYVKGLEKQVETLNKLVKAKDTYIKRLENLMQDLIKKNIWYRPAFYASKYAYKSKINKLKGVIKSDRNKSKRYN